MHDENLPCTNNSVETWHWAFQQMVDCNHPLIFKLINHFHLEQDHVEIEIEQHLACVNQPEAFMVDARLWCLHPLIGRSACAFLSALFCRRSFVGALLSCALLSGCREEATIVEPYVSVGVSRVNILRARPHCPTLLCHSLCTACILWIWTYFWEQF